MNLVPVVRAAGDPHLLPHRFLFDEQLITFVPTSRERLASASFLDGREDFSIGAPLAVKLDDLQARMTPVSGPDRYIFHIAFCGSTLLSRLLEANALVLREPQILVDIATRRAAFDKAGGTDPALPAALDLARALLRRPWETGQPVVVKPTNWVNNILPDLTADPEAMRPIFMTMARAAFVRAVFRGGSDRIAFAARAAVHLSSRGQKHAELVARALNRDTDEQGKLAALAIVTHDIQIESFRAVMARGGWDACHWLTMDELLADPLAAAVRAANVLALDIPTAALERNCVRWAGRHAKQPDADYSRDAETIMDEKTAASHRHVIEDALAWAEEVLGPDQGLFVRSQPVTESRGAEA